MHYFVYILHSAKLDRYYIGRSTDPETRHSAPSLAPTQKCFPKEFRPFKNQVKSVPKWYNVYGCLSSIFEKSIYIPHLSRIHPAFDSHLFPLIYKAGYIGVISGWILSKTAGLPNVIKTSYT